MGVFRQWGGWPEPDVAGHGVVAFRDQVSARRAAGAEEARPGPARRMTEGKPLCGDHATVSSAVSRASSEARASRTRISATTGMPSSCRTTPGRPAGPSRGRPAGSGPVGSGWHDQGMTDAAVTRSEPCVLAERSAAQLLAGPAARTAEEAAGTAAGHPGAGSPRGPAGRPGPQPWAQCGGHRPRADRGPVTGDQLAEPWHPAPGPQRGLLAAAPAHHPAAGHGLRPPPEPGRPQRRRGRPRRGGHRATP